MSNEAIAIVGVGVALLAVLVPLLLAQGRRLDRIEARIDARIDALAAAVEAVRTDLHAEIVSVRTDLQAEIVSVRAELAEVRRDVHALSERVARVEGALTGPWRPPNGAPAASPSASPAPPDRESIA